MEVKKVIVVGSGLMGSGIAQVCAQAGIKVFLNDVSQKALNKAIKAIEWSVVKFIEKGKLIEEKQAIIERITPIKDLSKAKNVDQLKQQIFERLDQFCGPNTLFASNTSAIPISDLAAVTDRTDKVLGLHFFSPVPMMQVVEVIKGIAIEAMKLVEQGVVSIEDVDKGLRLGLGRKMGIFETGDMVGLDVTYGALMAMYKETGNPRWYPPLLLRRKVKAGQLGRKTGEGWYRYDKEGNKVKGLERS